MNKIIQILLTPNDDVWQGSLLGLDSNGITHRLSYDGKWEVFIPAVEYKGDYRDDKAEK